MLISAASSGHLHLLQCIFGDNYEEVKPKPTQISSSDFFSYVRSDHHRRVKEPKCVNLTSTFNLHPSPFTLHPTVSFSDLLSYVVTIIKAAAERM